MVINDDVLFALGLTVFAGLSTGIGSLIGFLSKKFNSKFLSGALGFSAGVMIYVSMVKIFSKQKMPSPVVLVRNRGIFSQLSAFLLVLPLSR